MTDFSVSDLPRLASDGGNFVSVFEFESALLAALRPYERPPEFDARLLVAPEVLEVASELVGRGPPARFTELMGWLYLAFRPTSATAIDRVLQRFVWDQPPANPCQFTVTASLIAFNAKFSRLKAALELAEVPAARLYRRALRGDLSGLLDRELDVYAEGLPNFETVRKAAMKVARTIDTAAADGFIAAPAASPDIPPDQPAQPQAPQQSSAAPTFPHGKLLPQQYAELVRQGICVRCREKHIPGQTPKCAAFPDRRAPSAPRLEATAPSQPAQASLNPIAAATTKASFPTAAPVVKKPTVSPVQQLRRSERLAAKPKAPEEVTSVARVRVVATDTTPATRSAADTSGSPTPSTQGTKPTEAATITEVVEAIVARSPHAVWLDITGSHAGGAVALKAKADPGADISTINRKLATELRMKASPRSPIVIQVGNGAKETCSSEVIVETQLTTDAPERTVHLLLTENTPPGPYALIGNSDLLGFALNMTVPPTLAWIGSPTDEDLADPIELPEPEIQSATCPAATPQVVLGDQVNSPERRSQLEEILRKHAAVFSPLDAEPAHLPPFDIELVSGAQPVHSRVRYLSPDKRRFLQEDTARQLATNLLRPIESPWASPPVVVRKKNGAYRWCGDYTRVNLLTVKDKTPIPDSRDRLNWLAQRSILFKTDLVWGYQQIACTPNASRILAIITEEGLWGPTRMPFGPTNAPAHFQRAIASSFKDVVGVINFFDDIAGGACTWADFVAVVDAFLARCAELHIKLNASKTTMGTSTLTYVGRVVGNGSISVDPDSIAPIRDAAPPRDKATLQSFLGTAQWFGAFVPHMASLLSPLSDLLHRGVEFVWTAELQSHFDAVKVAIVSAQPLTFPRPDIPFILRTDASNVGIAGVLLQEIDFGGETRQLPIACVSRKLSAAERKYATIEAEALAIVFSLTRLRQFISGRVTILTDHSNLQFLRNSENARVQRWSLVLTDFDFIIVYAPGESNFLADWLSRAFDVVQHRGNDVLALEVCDPTPPPDFSAIVSSLPHHIDNNILVLENPPPKEIQLHIWALGHGDVFSGHLGRRRTLQRIRTAIRWAGMEKDIDSLTDLCPRCQKLRATRPTSDVSGETAVASASAPFEFIEMDYIGPLPTVFGMSYIFVTRDCFSRFVGLEATADATTQTTTAVISDRWICQYGFPRKIISDGGPSFGSEAFAKWARANNIEHHITVPLHPQSHGAVERVNRDIEQYIRGLLHDHPNWPSLVQSAAFSINSSFCRAIGCSPFQVVHGTVPRLRIHAALGTDPERIATDENEEPLGFAEALAELIPKQLAIIREIQERDHAIAQKLARRAAKGQTDFKDGDHVLVWFPRRNKLDLEWRGPFQVESRESAHIYRIIDLLDGSRQRVHVDRLHIFWPGNLTDQQLRAEATKVGEYLISAVHRHAWDDNGELWLRVDWLGFPDTNDEDDDAWVRLADCRFDATVKQYLRNNKLKPTTRPRRHRTKTQQALSSVSS